MLNKVACMQTAGWPKLLQLMLTGMPYCAGGVNLQQTFYSLTNHLRHASLGIWHNLQGTLSLQLSPVMSSI